MKAYAAWVKAKYGQKIYRMSRPDTVFVRSEDPILLPRVFGVDFSANDWEVVKEMKSLTFFYENLTELQYNVPPGVPGDTRLRVTIEWEE